MLIVREVFTAKPGQASKLAKLFKRSMGAETGVRVLTDYIGDYNTVVIEMQVENMAQWERQIEEYKSGKAPMGDTTPEEWASYTTMWKTGRREVWQVVE